MAVDLVSPEDWPRGAGYAHGTAATGRIVCTAGQIGWDPRTQQLVGSTMAAQAAQAMANVAAVLDAAGARPADIVRMTWFITDRAAYIDARKEIGVAYREQFGRQYPAVTVVFVAGLLEEGALIEIEATAVVSDK